MNAGRIAIIVAVTMLLGIACDAAPQTTSTRTTTIESRVDRAGLRVTQLDLKVQELETVVERLRKDFESFTNRHMSRCHSLYHNIDCY